MCFPQSSQCKYKCWQCGGKNINIRAYLFLIQLISTPSEKHFLSHDLFYDILALIYTESISKNNASTLWKSLGSWKLNFFTLFSWVSDEKLNIIHMMCNSEIKDFETEGNSYIWPQILVLGHILRQNGFVGQIDLETLHIISLSWRFKLYIKHIRDSEKPCNKETW